MELAIPMGFDERRTALPDAVLPGSVPPTTSVKAYDYYLQARNLLQQSSTLESLDAAVERFTQAIQYDTGFAAAYAGLCATLVRQLQYRPMTNTVDLATNVCRQSVELDPESIDAHTAYGHLYRVTGRAEKAIDQYRWVIGQQPRAVDAYLGIGATYASAAEFDNAERAYRYAIHVKPDYAEAYREYAQFLFSRGRYREVMEVGRQLIQLNSVSISGYNALGQAAFASGHFDTAIAAFREVIRREPTSEAFANMGAGYYYLGRYQAAIGMYTGAAELGPLEHRVWGELGNAYLQAGDAKADAVKAYARARDLAQRAPWSSDIRALCSSSIRCSKPSETARGWPEHCSARGPWRGTATPGVRYRRSSRDVGGHYRIPRKIQQNA